MSIGVAIGKGAGAGVLIKSAEALERMEQVNTLVVDKTGTLTEGKPRVTAIVPAAGLSETEILPLAASLERSSEHPLAAAILMAANDRGLATKEPTDFASVTGKGVTGKIDGKSVALGNAKLMADLGIAFGDLDRGADELRGDGATALFLAIDHKPGGVIAIADPIKATTQAALETLREQRPADRDADWRQQDDGCGGCPQAGDQGNRSGRSAAGQESHCQETHGRGSHRRNGRRRSDRRSGSGRGLCWHCDGNGTKSQSRAPASPW